MLVETFTPGTADRLGLGYDALHALNPRLVYCSITGYGRGTGEQARPGFDGLVAARTGFQWELRGWYGGPMYGAWADKLRVQEDADPPSSDPHGH